ncbi:MAG: HAD hydrolase-like protein, partial [Alphaproteobacteria bacterium]
FPEIFDRLFAEMPDISRNRAVMVGDGLATDVRGARRAGIDAIWIAGGIHAVELGLARNGQFDPRTAQKVAEAAGEWPRAVMSWLRW